MLSRLSSTGMTVKILYIPFFSTCNHNDSLERERVTLRPTIYRQSVHLGDKPLETHD
jgi:hypothetical protein